MAYLFGLPITIYPTELMEEVAEGKYERAYAWRRRYLEYREMG